MPKTAKEKAKRTRKRTIVIMGTKDTLERGAQKGHKTLYRELSHWRGKKPEFTFRWGVKVKYLKVKRGVKVKEAEASGRQDGRKREERTGWNGRQRSVPQNQIWGSRV
jgi:hypothetical protein